MLDATIKETVIGKAEIRDVIRVPRWARLRVAWSSTD
jgi:hypothetical protein